MSDILRPPTSDLGGPTVCPSGGDSAPFVVTTRVDDLVNWFRESSIWYLLFATACCGIELMQTGGPRTDLDRFGAVFRSTPRQSDLLIVAGTITYKMADRVRLIYAQMAEPKYVMAMGSCANCGGLFQPRPEALNEAILRLQDLMKQEHWASRRKGRTPEKDRT